MFGWALPEALCASGPVVDAGQVEMEGVRAEAGG